LDPLSRSINTTLAGRYRDLHQYDEAIAVNQRTLELDPNFRMAHELMASIFEQQGNFQSAVAEWQKAVELSRDNPSELAALGHAYAISGNQTAARKILEKLQPISKRQYVAEWDMAVLFAGLGDADDAFQCLERSYRERESQMPFLNQDSRLASLRSDPRFHDMLRKVGLLG
jgi:tetratricopeptide (TPR) repeat protein